MSQTTKRPGRPRIAEITESQRRTLRVIDQYIREHGNSPSLQEIADTLKISPATALDQVKQLVRKGYLAREPNKARSMTVLRSPETPIARLVRVPLLGSVAAGRPVLADENVIGEVWVEGHVVGGDRCFALRVCGDSMNDANIVNDDLVVVRQQQLAQDGEVVVALVDGETTVKRLYIRDHVIQLRPDNRDYEPIPIDPNTDFRILGKVIAVRHTASAE